MIEYVYICEHEARASIFIYLDTIDGLDLGILLECVQPLTAPPKSTTRLLAQKV